MKTLTLVSRRTQAKTWSLLANLYSALHVLPCIIPLPCCAYT
jgi:hypothetical protein